MGFTWPAKPLGGRGGALVGTVGAQPWQSCGDGHGGWHGRDRVGMAGTGLARVRMVMAWWGRRGGDGEGI